MNLNMSSVLPVLDSMPVVEYTKKFVTSVIVGKDVVPRIGLSQMEALRADLLNAIKKSRKPKVGFYRYTTGFSSFFLLLRLLFRLSLLHLSLYSCLALMAFSASPNLQVSMCFTLICVDGEKESEAE